MSVSQVPSRPDHRPRSPHGNSSQKDTVDGALAKILQKDLEGVRILVASADEQSLQEGLVSGETPAQLCSAVASAFAVAKVDAQPLWRAIVSAAGRIADASEQSSVLTKVARCLGEANSKDLVVWTELLHLAKTASEASTVLGSVVSGMTEAVVTSEVLWLDLTRAAVELADVERAGLLEKVATALAEGCVSFTAPTVWMELVQAIASVAPDEKTKLCNAVAQGMLGAAVRDSSIWNFLLQVVGNTLEEGDQADAFKVIAQGIGEIRVNDRSIWQTLIGHARGFSGDSATLCEGIANGMGQARVADAVLWKALLDVAALVSAEAQAELLLLIAQQMGEADVQDESAWRSLLQQANDDEQCVHLCESIAQDLDNTHISVLVCNLAVQVAGTLAPDRRAETLETIASCPACADASVWKPLIAQVRALEREKHAELCTAVAHHTGWAAVIEHVKTLADDEQLELLVAIVVSLKTAHHMEPSTWANLVTPPPDQTVLDFVAQALAHEAARTKDAPANHRAVLNAYAVCEPALLSPFLNGPKPRREFADLGEEMRLQLIAGLNWTAEYRSIYEAMLRSAVQRGTLGLNDIDAVKEIRWKVRDSAPELRWQVLDAPTQANGMRGTFCGYPKLAEAVGVWAASLQPLINALLKELRLRPQHEQKTLAVPLTKAFRAILDIVDVDDVTRNMVNPRLPALLETMYGEDGKRDVTVDQRLLNRLLERQNKTVKLTGKAVKAIEAVSSVARALTDKSNSALQKLGAAWEQSWKKLDALLGEAGFNERYDDAYFYTIEPLDKNAVPALTIGADVSCCLAPDGTEFAALIERLISPAWVPVVVRQGDDARVAVAWCALSEEWVVDFTDMKPSYTQPTDRSKTASALGNQVIDQLLSFLPTMANAVGLKEVWVGKQRYGRLEAFPTFKSRDYQQQQFSIVGSSSMLRPFYSDNIAPTKGGGLFALSK